MIWLMLWLTCSSAGCYQERVEQEFETLAACEYALAFYRAQEGVVGVCAIYTEVD